MKILKIIFIIIASIIGLFIIIPAFLSSDFRMERSIEINAPAKNAFILVNNLRNWEKWSPWNGVDTNMVITYSGPENGVGASYSWRSEVPEVGNGKLTITDSDKYKLIKTRLMFADDDDAGKGIWLFSESGGVTTVTWGISGTWNGYFEKWFGVFMGSMMGPDFEKGLSKIKELAENMKEYKFDISIEEVKPQHIIFISDTCGTETSEIGTALGKAFAEINAFMDANNISPSGKPMAVSRLWDMENDRYIFDAAMPVDINNMELTGRLQYGTTYSGKAAKAVNFGPYSKIMPAYEAILKYIEDNKLEISGYSWEVFMSRPAEAKPEEIETHIYFPVK